jgi:hypothetical protein
VRADRICVSPAARDVSPDFTRFAIAGQTTAAAAAFDFAVASFPELLIAESAAQQASIDWLRTGAGVAGASAGAAGTIAAALGAASPEGAATAVPLGTGSAATAPVAGAVDTGIA